MKLSEGDVCFLPSGYLLLSFSFEGATIARKSFSPAFEGRERKRSFEITLQCLEAYRNLHTTVWGEWSKALGSAA